MATKKTQSADQVDETEAGLALIDEVETLTAQRDALVQEIAQLKATPTGAKPAKKYVPRWKRYTVRAVSRGFCNNRAYDAGEEFSMVVDANLDPPSWVEYLDDGVATDVNTNSQPNAVDFAKAEPQKPQTGFAAGV